MNKRFHVIVCCFLAVASYSFARATGTEYIVTVTVAGGGQVFSSPPGIECTQEGGDCSAKFSAQTPVTLTPREEAQYSFQGWSAATGSATQCPATNGPCSFVLGSDTAVAATFVPAPRSSRLPVILEGPKACSAQVEPHR